MSFRIFSVGMREAAREQKAVDAASCAAKAKREREEQLEQERRATDPLYAKHAEQIDMLVNSLVVIGLLAFTYVLWVHPVPTMIVIAIATLLSFIAWIVGPWAYFPLLIVIPVFLGLKVMLYLVFTIIILFVWLDRLNTRYEESRRKNGRTCRGSAASSI